MITTRIAVLVFLLSAAAYFASGQEKRASSASDGNRLKCEGSINNSDLAYSEKNEARISIRNLRTTNVTVNNLAVYLSPSYYLGPYDTPSEEAYVALVDLETKGPLELMQQGQYPSKSLRVVAGREESFKVNLSGLQWEKTKSSLIPPPGLNWVALGKYTLYVQIAEGEETLQHTSNRKAVTLHK